MQHKIVSRSNRRYVIPGIGGKSAIRERKKNVILIPSDRPKQISTAVQPNSLSGYAKMIKNINRGQILGFEPECDGKVVAIKIEFRCIADDRLRQSAHVRRKR